MKIVSSLVGALVAAAFMPLAQAHHSAAVFYFVDKTVTVEGVVKSYTLGNPHARIYMTVKGPNGEDQSWMAEGGSRTVLLRNGWTGDEVKPGDHIKIVGSDKFLVVAVGLPECHARCEFLCPGFAA